MNVDQKHGKSQEHGWDIVSKIMLCVGIVLSVFLNLGFIFGIPLIVFAFIRSKSKTADKRKKEELVFSEGLYKFLEWIESYRKKKMKSIYNKGNNKVEKTYTTIICPSCFRRLRVPENRGNIRICCPVCSHKFKTKT